MSNKTKQQLITENNANFPNNNSGFITPEKLRTFNGDMIDSTVNEIEYAADSGSFNTRILESVVTASLIGDTITFEKENGNTFDITISGATIPPGTVSGSSQINYPQISNIPAGIVSGSSQVTPLLPSGVVSGSSQVTSLLPSGVVSGSSQISYPQISNIPAGIVSGSSQITPLLPSGVVSGSSQVSYTGLSNIPSGIVSSSSQIILQQTSGNLSGSRIDGLVLSSSFAISASHSELADLATLATNATNATYAQNTITTGKNLHNTTIAKGTPLFFTGSGTSGNLVGVFPADAGNPERMPAGGIAGESLAVGGEGIVLLDGYIGGVNTTQFASGDEIFVAVGGGYTNVPPTGSALIQHLGNVEKSAVNGSGVIQMMGEVRGLPNILQGHTWVGDSNGVPQVVTTGSLSSYIFTQNNTFTGTQTFNNIAVNGTASIAYLESVTGSAKIIGDAFIILNNDTPTERYAGIIIIDSGSTFASASFLFDGQNNDWFYEYTSALDNDNFGVVLFGPEYNTKGSPIYNTNNRIVKGDGGHHILDSNISDDGTTVSINSNTQITGSLSINGNTPLINSDLTSLNSFTQSQQSVNTNLNTFTESADGRLDNIELTTASLQTQINGLSGVSGSYATTGSNTFVGNQVISGSTTITGELGITPVVAPNSPPGGIVQYIIPFLSGSNNVFARDQDNALSWLPFSNQLAVSSSVANASITPGNFNATNSSGNSSLVTSTLVRNRPVVGKLIGITGDPSLTGLTGLSTTNPAIVLESGSSAISYYTPIQFESSQSFTDGRVTVTRPLVGLQGAQITGSFSVSGSVNTSVHNLTIASQTASLDGSIGNMFVLNLVSATDTRLEVSNLKSGQTINLLVSQSSTGNGTLTTAGNLLEPSGSEYSASQVANAQDLLTLATFFNPNVVYVANIKTMI